MIIRHKLRNARWKIGARIEERNIAKRQLEKAADLNDKEGGESGLIHLEV